MKLPMRNQKVNRTINNKHREISIDDGMNQVNPPYNLTYLNEISSGDQQFVLSILSQFVKDTPVLLNEIREAYKKRDWADLHFLVHKFASTLLLVGLNDIHEEVSRLENFVKNRTDSMETGLLVEIVNHRCEVAVQVIKQDFNL